MTFETKFKDITSDKIIHTKTDEESKMLLDHLNKLGYEFKIFASSPVTRKITIDDIGYKYYHVQVGHVFLDHNGDPINDRLVSIIRNVKDISYLPNLVEFSDLIEYEMSAKDVLEWFSTTKDDVIGNVFSRHYSIDGVITHYTPDEIVKRIITYENSVEARKEALKNSKYVGGLEWVNFVRIVSKEDDECVYEEEIKDGSKKEPTEKILTKYIQEHDGEYFAVVERRCRKISYEN